MWSRSGHDAGRDEHRLAVVAAKLHGRQVVPDIRLQPEAIDREDHALDSDVLGLLQAPEPVTERGDHEDGTSVGFQDQSAPRPQDRLNGPDNADRLPVVATWIADDHH